MIVERGCVADASLASIDVGFDVRAQRMPCAIPVGTASVCYTGTDGGQWVVRGTIHEIVAHLTNEGYLVEVVS